MMLREIVLLYSLVGFTIAQLFSPIKKKQDNPSFETKDEINCSQHHHHLLLLTAFLFFRGRHSKSLFSILPYSLCPNIIKKKKNRLFVFSPVL